MLPGSVPSDTLSRLILMTVLQGGDDYLLDSMREQSLRAFRALCLPSQPLFDLLYSRGALRQSILAEFMAENKGRQTIAQTSEGK